jgi:WhiB family redox-sensing transcriptional regulator
MARRTASVSIAGTVPSLTLTKGEWERLTPPPSNEPLPNPMERLTVALTADWRLEAACRGMPANLFFPDKEDGSSTRQAKAVCAGCPVRSECLEASIEFGDKHGVWGGLSEKQRRGLRRKRRGGDIVKWCAYCGDRFETDSPTAKYCKTWCGEAARRRQNAGAQQRHRDGAA